MNVAVFGYGSMGTRHAQNAVALGHDVMVHDPLRGLGHPGEVAERELIRQSHAVVIASPAATHARLLWQALWFSRPVYVEKPLAMNATQTGELAARFADATERVVVGYNLRHHPHVVALKRWAESSNRPVGTFYVLCDMATWPGTTYADALLECSHEIDLALWMLGPASVRRARQTSDGKDWTITLSHDNGGESLVQIGTDRNAYARGAVLADVTRQRGTSGGWTWHAPSARSTYSDGEGITNLDVSADDTYRAALAAFLDAAGEPDRPGAFARAGCTFAEAARVLEACDAARAAAQNP